MDNFNYKNDNVGLHCVVHQPTTMIVREKKQIRIGGLTPLTTIDYPHHLSCVIYCQGCSWRCRYCHNPDLLKANINGSHQWYNIIEFLKKRRGLLEAVVFSGGEPLTQKYLVSAIKQVKALGFKVGLHTAGSISKRFEEVLTFVDWVGFDVKDLAEYSDALTQVKNSGVNNWHSLNLLTESAVDFQCRTTVHWQLINQSRLIQLTQKLVDRGVEDYAIQFCRTNTMLDPSLGHSVIADDQLIKLKHRLYEIMPSISFNDY